MWGGVWLAGSHFPVHLDGVQLLSLSWLGAIIASAAPQPEAIVDTAKGYLGDAYVYGASEAGAFDCSGFTSHVFGAHGVALPRTSRDQASAGTRVGFGELRPGDLVFFTDKPGGKNVTHVGIALDATHMIHASTGRGRIVIDDLEAKHWRERRLSARRVVAGAGPAPKPLTLAQAKPPPQAKPKVAKAGDRRDKQQKPPKKKRVTKQRR